MNLQRDQKPYVFHPPRYSQWLAPVFYWICRLAFLRHKFKIRKVRTKGAYRLAALAREGHSLLIAPNHADHVDPSLLLHVGRQHGMAFHFMAAREGFEKGWLQAFVLQRCGAFSVDREGADVAAIKMAMNILIQGRHPLVIFPEGEIYHHHERLDALNDGVATILLRATARVPDQRGSYVVPTAIRITHDDSVRASFSDRLSHLENHVTWKPRPEMEPVQRIYRLGGGLLALKEEEFLGRSRDGSLEERIAHLQGSLVESIESQQGIQDRKGTLPERIKAVRQRIRQELNRDPQELTDDRQKALYDQLDTLFLAHQLYSYADRYLLEQPSTHRLAETLFKLEEDVFGEGTYHGPRDAEIRFGEPVDVREFLAKHNLNARTGVPSMTRLLSTRIQALLNEAA